MDMETKTVHPVEVKFDDEAGSVRAVFATLNQKDSDGDVTLAGFFGEQQVAIAESHDRSKLVGKGRIFETGDTAVMEGKYFLETIQGRESYLTAKAMGDLQEWSYGFYIEKGGARLGQHNGENVRFLQPKDDGTPGALVAEVSTVLVGAGVGTHTQSIKSQEGSRFVEQAETVARAAEMLVIRATEIRDMRGEKGKELGAEAVAKLQALQERFFAAAEMFGGLTPAEPAPPHTKLRMQHMVDQANAVLEESLRLIGDHHG